jgi:hypothetical protein
MVAQPVGQAVWFGLGVNGCTKNYCRGSLNEVHVQHTAAVMSWQEPAQHKQGHAYRITQLSCARGWVQHTYRS